MNKIPEPEFLSKRNASIYSSVSVRSLDSARARGVLPFIRFGVRRVLFKREDLDRWLSTMRVDARSEDDRLAADGRTQ